MDFIALAAKKASAAEPTSGLPMLLVFGVFILIFYFLMIRPQKKRQKKEEAMRNNLQIGDEITTIGGITGRVVSLKEDSIVLESPADHSKIKIMRWAIQSNNTAHDEEPKKK